MNKKSLIVFLLVACVALVSAFYNFSVADAQTNDNTRDPKVASPTPPTEDLGTPPPLPIDNKDEIIKIDTELVNLNVRVIDRNNRPINTLSQNDFHIFEDNVPQKIDSFTKEEVPTNYSLVLDNSGSLRFQLDKVIEASKIIVDTNRPDDETSVIRFVSQEKITIEQDFTSDKNDLFDTLDNLYVEGGQTAIIDAVYLAVERVGNYEKTGRLDDRKRRAIILVTDGEDRDSFYKEPQLYELLRESDVQIYAIGFVNELDKEGGFISKSPQKKAKQFLERMATETGGKVYFPNSLSELNDIAKDIATELRTQYVISYYPTNTNQDGSFRKIKVDVSEGPGNQKRIAITRSGRKASPDGAATPNSQTPTRKVSSKQ